MNKRTEAVENHQHTGDRKNNVIKKVHKASIFFNPDKNDLGEDEKRIETYEKKSPWQALIKYCAQHKQEKKEDDRHRICRP